MNAPVGSFLNERLSPEQNDKLLADIQAGWEPPCSTRDLDRVYEDALRALARGIPDPVDVAREIEVADPWLGEALHNAYRSTRRDSYGSWRVNDTAAPYLRRMGVVAIEGPWLTAFGTKVRLAVIEERTI